MESIKNGMFLSTKYLPKKKVLKETPHVVVFANFKPDTIKMSLDRWTIDEIIPE